MTVQNGSAIVGALLLVAGPSFAGDYGLLITDGTDAGCAAQRVAPKPERLASDAASIRLRTALTAKDEGLEGVFANGRIAFCNQRARLAFEAGLLDLATAPALHEGHWRDVARMLQSKSLLRELERRLGEHAIAGSARKRLARLHRDLVPADE